MGNIPALWEGKGPFPDLCKGPLPFWDLHKDLHSSLGSFLGVDNGEAVL